MRGSHNLGNWLSAYADGRKSMNTTLDNSSVWQTRLLWAAVALLGVVAFAIVALNRGEAVNAAWLVTAAVCIYLIAFRFYGLSARHAVDPGRRSIRRRGPGYDGLISVDAARWPFAWRYRTRRDGTNCRHDRRYRHSHDLRHRTCGIGSRRRQGPDRQPMGNLCSVLHDPNRLVYGALQSVHPSRPYWRDVAHRLRAVARGAGLRKDRVRDSLTRLIF